MKQEFRKIPSLDFRYEVSRDGIVRNIKSKKIKKQFITKFGYYRTNYRVNKTNSHYSPNGWDRPLHQLVMECWGPKKPNENYVIDHIDQNPQNNNIDNLQCITKQENIKKSNNHSARPQKSYLVIDTETGQEQKFVNAEAASEFLGVSSAHVRTTARGKATTNLIGGRYKVKTIPLIA